MVHTGTVKLAHSGYSSHFSNTSHYLMYIADHLNKGLAAIRGMAVMPLLFWVSKRVDKTPLISLCTWRTTEQVLAGFSSVWKTESQSGSSGLQF